MSDETEATTDTVCRHDFNEPCDPRCPINGTEATLARCEYCGHAKAERHSCLEEEVAERVSQHNGLRDIASELRELRAIKKRVKQRFGSHSSATRWLLNG